MGKRILQGFIVAVGIALVAVAVWLYGKHDEPVTSPPAAEVSQTPPGSEASSTPWPTQAAATPGGVVVTVAPGANTDQLDAAVAVGSRWVSARYALDPVALPYPGLDVAAVEAPVTGGAAEDIGYQVQDWRAPRSVDQQAYDEQKAQQFRREVRVEQVYVADHADGRRLTFEYQLVTRSNQLRQPSVEQARVQLLMVSQDGQWKISAIDEEPQSL